VVPSFFPFAVTSTLKWKPACYKSDPGSSIPGTLVIYATWDRTYRRGGTARCAATIPKSFRPNGLGLTGQV
jgi:hypothetical protein